MRFRESSILDQDAIKKLALCDEYPQELKFEAADVRSYLRHLGSYLQLGRSEEFMQRYSYSIALRIWHPNITPDLITQVRLLRAHQLPNTRCRRRARTHAPER